MKNKTYLFIVFAFITASCATPTSKTDTTASWDQGAKESAWEQDAKEAAWAEAKKRRQNNFQWRDRK